MAIPNHIRHLERARIDTGRWDDCVRQSPNGFLYAQSFYLDGIGDWTALVAGDYEWILPLPTRMKYGIPYNYIPPFTGQLGIVGKELPDTAGVNQFITQIPRRIRLTDLLMNELNPSPSLPDLRVSPRTNYILALEKDYPTLRERYTADAKKNLRRTERAGLSVKENIPMKTVLQLYRSAYGAKNRHIGENDYQNMERLGQACMERQLGFTLGITDPAGDILAAAFFGKDNKRIYYIVGAPTREGRQQNATHSLIDEVIRQYAGSGLTLDFEGSDIPSVADFYRKFSPETTHYDLVRINKLPRWIKWLV